MTTIFNHYLGLRQSSWSKYGQNFWTMNMVKIQIFQGQNIETKMCPRHLSTEFPFLSLPYREITEVSVAMVNFLAIDHGTNSRVSLSWLCPVHLTSII